MKILTNDAVKCISTPKFISLFSLIHPQIILDIFFHTFFRSINAEVSLTKYIGLKIKQFFHRFFPFFDVRPKAGQEWAMDILPEKDAAAVDIKVHRHTARGMAWDMPKVQLVTAKL